MERKTFRERYEESYTAVPVPADNKQGFRMKYIYYAPWYRWDLPAKKLWRGKFIMLFVSAAGFLLSLSCMAQRTAVNRMLAVFAPCVLMLCCHIMELSGLIRFFAARARTTKMNYDEVNKLIRTFPMLRAVMGNVPMTVCVYTAVTGERPLFHLAMALAYGALSATAMGITRYYSRIPVCVEANNALELYDKMEALAESKNI